MHNHKLTVLTSLFSLTLLVSVINCRPSEAQKNPSTPLITAAVAQTPSSASQHLIAEWHFEDATGDTAADTSGKNNTGKLQGDASRDADVVGKSALRLSGKSGSFVDIEKPVIDTSKSFTVSACVKVHRLNGFQTFVSIDGDAVSGFFFQLRDDTGTFALAMPLRDSASENNPAIASASEEPDPDRWYHLTGVHDAEAHTISLYVNGILQQTVPFRTPWRANGHTAIGRGKYGGNPVDFVEGSIDAVRIYDAALPAADVLALANADLPSASRQATAPIPPATLKIDVARAATPVSPMLYGMMTEEINYSYEGGLYAELIRNRDFQYKNDEPTHWSLVQAPGSMGSMVIDTTAPVTPARPNSLKVQITKAQDGQPLGVANAGFWGIPVKPNTTYRASFFAKAAPGFAGPLTVALTSNDGATVHARSTVARLTDKWQRYSVTLKTGRTTPSTDNRFVLSVTRPGTLWLSQVSLFPPTYKNRANGNRIDLMELQAGMKPAFLRLPGGNYLEGNTIAERFDWKKTLGGISERPGHPCPWGYRSTDGMGLMEFLMWCEELKMEPVLGVFAGYALRGEYIPAGPKLEPFVQDALDEIEYITGDTNTKWGLVRARDGHPKPFPLTYVEVGNEDWFDRSGSYDGRFAQFYDAIKKKYPKLQIIATTGVKSRKPDVIDEHYYRSPRAFQRAARQYDTYDRKGPKIFVGEWASQTGRPTPDLNSALGDAAWLTGMERNSDIVVMEAYAPLFVNVNPGASQWGTNLIGYDALRSYGSPSYYVQQMFGQQHGDRIVPTTITGGKQIFESVTRDSKHGTLFVKLVNAANAEQSVHVSVEGIRSVRSNGKATILKGADLKDTNTIQEPKKLVPVTMDQAGLGKEFDLRLAPYSVTVLRMEAK